MNAPPLGVVSAPDIRNSLWKASKALEAIDQSSISKTGLCLSDFLVLESLMRLGPLSVSAIGENVLLTSGSITTAVQRVEKKGLVLKEPDTADRRVIRVRLTQTGNELIANVFRSHQHFMEQAVRNLSLEEREQLLKLLQKLGKGADTFRSVLAASDI